MKIYEKEYCMSCGEENPQDREICECGGRKFVFGNGFTFENKKVICNCGNDQLQMILHINMSPIYNVACKCNKCKNVIYIQNYYESPYFG